MVKIKYGLEYYQSYRELIEKQPDLEDEINKHIQWFSNDPEDTRLKNHKLKKRMRGKFAFSITGDIRIVYKRLGKNEVRFLIIGGHKKVYGRK